MRYQVCYCKTTPLCTWVDSKERAAELAAQYRRVGYYVTVWEHNDKGARLTDL